ncbi:nucleotidyltransferase domain-containing protein [Nodosilinea sp. FACHB-131]|uniref:nucleotidyltransferase family protein n=1 Tax=Cyanophyceae TaxID=3028117 RepID=UPI00168933B4|nr:nucleotidyltransferase domain-containing protein [Nodosilinea sp. FACHB-131]MBD1874887.1 nucleotidyltransferase domain-containing protein [Nodosilinea sp. FACHB-131]
MDQLDAEVLPALAFASAIEAVRSKQFEIAKLCQLNQVAQLDLFGSATQLTFDPATSDLDFIVDFLVDTPEGAADRFFGLRQGLSDTLGRTIDLVDVKAIKNPYFLQAIAPSRLTIHGC